MNDLRLECFHEVKRQFPGSAPHIMKEMADRLFEEARCDIPRHPMVAGERYLRTVDLCTAFQSVPEIRGIRPGDRRLDNAKD